MKHINIEQFSNGELTQQINREMEAVARNIADPNTEAKTARKITVTITMKPNEQRDFITTSITTKSALAPTLGAVTALGIRKDLKSGEIEVTSRLSTRLRSVLMIVLINRIHSKQRLNLRRRRRLLGTPS